MKLVHVVGTISLESSGPSQSVPILCRSLAELGVEVELHYIDYGGRPEVPMVLTRPYPRTKWSILDSAAWNAPMLRGLRRSTQSNDTIIHAHGLWHFPTIYPVWIQFSHPVPWVMSPRGTLGRWPLSQARAKKAISLALGQRRALQRASLLHATSLAEAEDFRRFGLEAPILVLPNALSLEASFPSSPEERRDVLFLSRLHPKKAADRLLMAWKDVAEAYPTQRLILAGPSEGTCQRDLEALVHQHRIPRVEFPGELRGEAKWQALANAKTFILPSHHENFGMVVAEAMAAGTPVIASRGTPWQMLASEGAGWWVDNDQQNLARTLREALSASPDQLAQMGERARQLVETHFSPRMLAKQMLDAYESILRNRGPR